MESKAFWVKKKKDNTFIVREEWGKGVKGGRSNNSNKKSTPVTLKRKKKRKPYILKGKTIMMNRRNKNRSRKM